MTQFRAIHRLIRLAVGMPLITVPLLFTAVSTAHAEPAPPTGVCVGVTVPEGYICVPDPKQCFAAPCPQHAIVPAKPLDPALPRGEPTLPPAPSVR
ncbi:hypothetical protein AB0P15_28265 [Streptomyces sp. NPDC087917]|uniref:hypothetical protein n=1 Tax=Streptomyces sp. NPDC087917 TaxID=3155060 RepID=UPI00343E7399